jgi:hypothetical protein
LKILPIEIGDPAFAQGIERPAAPPEGRRDAQTGHGGEYVGSEQRGVPGDRRSPVVADDHGLRLAERFDQCDHVADGIENAVGVDIGGSAGPAESPHVRRDDMETGSRDRRDLMPPGIGQFGPAVTEQHQRPFALFEQKEFDPAGGNGV